MLDQVYISSHFCDTPFVIIVRERRDDDVLVFVAVLDMFKINKICPKELGYFYINLYGCSLII